MDTIQETNTRRASVIPGPGTDGGEVSQLKAELLALKRKQDIFQKKEKRIQVNFTNLCLTNLSKFCNDPITIVTPYNKSIISSRAFNYKPSYFQSVHHILESFCLFTLLFADIKIKMRKLCNILSVLLTNK